MTTICRRSAAASGRFWKSSTPTTWQRSRDSSSVADPPSDMAMRRLLSIWRKKDTYDAVSEGGRTFTLLACPNSELPALRWQRVLDTFFSGDVEQALAMHLTDNGAEISEEQFDRMLRLIQQARKDRE